MKNIDARLAKIERQREANTPPRPWLVVRSNEDASEALARFRVERGCEPGGTLHIKRAGMRKAGEPVTLLT